MSEKVLDAVRARFSDALRHTHRACGDDTLVIGREHALALFRFLKEDEAMAFDMPVDVCGVDYLTYESERPIAERFEIVYHLRSMRHGHRVRVRVPVPDDDPVVDSATSVWRGTNWFERETFDMFGVRFTGHPDLRRILLYDEFEGHPLRKDYPVRAYQPRVEMPRLQGDALPWQRPVDEEA